jgi:plastocyanin domain-containing protein
MKTLVTVLTVATLGAFLAGCSGSSTSTAEQAQSQTPAATETTPPSAPGAVTTDASGTRVRIEVTKDGFVPASFTVPAGKPVTLMVTRHVEKTCATSIVMKDFNINQPLPLDDTVELTFTPDKPGQHRFACPMDMVAGTMTVEDASAMQ